MGKHKIRVSIGSIVDDIPRYADFESVVQGYTWDESIMLGQAVAQRTKMFVTVEEMDNKHRKSIICPNK